MCFPAQPREAAGGVDGSDIGPDALQGGKRTALGFDFAQDVFADTDAEIGGRTGEPAPFFVKQVGGDSLSFLCKIAFVASRFVEGADGFVNLLSADRATGFQSISCREFAACYLLS